MKFVLSKEIKTFQKEALGYFKKYGRVLPWRSRPTPYRVFISEVMLQQTQVDRVIPFFNRFVGTFPSFSALARASVKDVLEVWQGLGYNRRALFLHKAAGIITKQHGGRLPADVERLVLLPGIGRATAASIVAFAFDAPAVFVETNIRTVFIHHFFKNKKNVSDTDIVPLLEKSLSGVGAREWYSALMDYGTMLKKVYGNANVRSAHHSKQSRFEGSVRQVRGAIIKELLKKSHSIRFFEKQFDEVLVEKALEGLQKEGVVREQRGMFLLV